MIFRDTGTECPKRTFPAAATLSCIRLFATAGAKLRQYGLKHKILASFFMFSCFFRHFDRESSAFCYLCSSNILITFLAYYLQRHLSSTDVCSTDSLPHALIQKKSELLSGVMTINLFGLLLTASQKGEVQRNANSRKTRQA